ncbi:MAG: hypothetical protein ABIR96_09215, partial [Bdellovibrionota bacterium]
MIFELRHLRMRLSVLAALTLVVPARAEIVRELVLSDGGELSEERVSDLLGVKVGQEISESKLEEGLKRLSNTGRFQSLEVRFDSEKGRVVLETRLYDVLEGVSFKAPGDTLSYAMESLVTRDVSEVTALSPGDRISLDQVAEVRERVIQRLRDRGFKDVQIVIALEAGEMDSQKKLLVSARLGKQDTVDEVEFQGFRGADLTKMRDIMEQTEYVAPYLKKLDVPADLLDRPEDYLITQFKRLRSADAGQPIVYGIAFPTDWVLINATLSEWGQLMRGEGFFDFRLQASVVDGPNGKRKLLIHLDRGPRYLVQFSGNVAFWERALRAKVLDRPMRLGLPLNLSEAQAQIRAMYLAEGFKDIKIEVRSEDKGSERRIVFAVNEGRRSFLGKILWDGLSPREVEILTEIESDWKARMSTPFHHVYFDERALRGQMPLLLSLIQSQGFLQARLLGFKAVPSSRSDRMDLEVPIQ